jgi:hypothetical protein
MGGPFMRLMKTSNSRMSRSLSRSDRVYGMYTHSASYWGREIIRGSQIAGHVASQGRRDYVLPSELRSYQRRARALFGYKQPES